MGAELIEDISNDMEEVVADLPLGDLSDGGSQFAMDQK
jgi:hypothetical protein